MLSQALPKYLPNEQIIFLATDTEFLVPITNWSDEKIEEAGGETMLAKDGHPEESFGQMLERNINVKYYKIQREDGNTVIKDLITKWSR